MRWAIYHLLIGSCKANRVNPLTYVRSHVRDKTITIQTPDECTVSNIAYIGGCVP